MFYVYKHRTIKTVAQDKDFKEMTEIQSYIDNTIETPKDLPKNILWFLKILEDHDNGRKENYELHSVLYFDRLDDLWVNAKNAIAAGVMSQKSWETIEQKYWTHAEYVDSLYEKEHIK